MAAISRNGEVAAPEICITSADGVFLFKDCLSLNANSKTVRVFSKQLREFVEVEQSVLKRVVRSGDIGRNWAQATALILYPYEIDGTDARLIEPRKFQRMWPLAWEYLERNNQFLRSRENGLFDDLSWYRFGRTQNLGMWEQPKLMIPYMITELSAYLDRFDNYYFINVTTGGYGIVTNEALCSLSSLCALLNSPVLDFCLKRISSNFQGGYFPANKQFIQQLPISLPSKREATQLNLVSELIQECRKSLIPNPDISTTRDPLMLAYWEQVLNGMIYELYFRDEVQKAGVRIFDLLENIPLPTILNLPESIWIKPLRAKFEELYDSSSPLRIALNKLQTLDSIRIIEGNT